MLWQHESTTQQDGRHVYFTAPPQGMLGHTITMHDVTKESIVYRNESKQHAINIPSAQLLYFLAHNFTNPVPRAADAWGFSNPTKFSSIVSPDAMYCRR